MERQKLFTALDKSLRVNGVHMSGNELTPVVNDLMALFDAPVPQVSQEAPPVSGTPELKPIPPTGG